MAALPARRCCTVLVPKHSAALQRWDSFVVILLLVVSFMTPYDTAFNDLRFDWVFCFNRLTEIVFILDMCARFFTAIPHPVRRGCWIVDPGVIATSYIRRHFVLDIISVCSLPLDTFSVVHHDLYGKYSWMKLCRTLRLLRVSSSGHAQIEQWQTSFGIQNWKLAMSKLFFLLTIACHWSACVWGSIVVRSPQEPNWLSALRSAKGGEDRLYSERYDIYMLSLYWAVMTMTTIGYGDVTPQNQTEYLVSILLMAAMAAVWTYVIGEICAILSTLSPHLFDYFRNLDDMNWLLQEWDVPHDTRIRIRRYFLESQDKARHESNKKIVEMVSTTMQGELAQTVNKAWLEKVSYLRTSDHDAIAEVAHRLETKMFAPQEEEHFDMTLCIVQRGSCGRKGRVLSRFDVWGEDMILRNHLLRDEAPSRALGYLQLLTLSWRDLEEVAHQYHGLQGGINVARLQIGLRRGVILIARVLRQLHFEGAIDLGSLTRRQYLILSDAVCSGTIVAGMSERDVRDKCGLDGPPDGNAAAPCGVDGSAVALGSSHVSVPSVNHTASSVGGPTNDAFSEIRTHAAELSIRMTSMNAEIKDFLATSVPGSRKPAHLC